VTRNEKIEYLKKCMELSLAFSDEAYCNNLRFKECMGYYMVTGVCEAVAHQVDTLYIDGVFKYIGESAFKGNTWIKHVIVGSGVKHLFDSCFEDCVNLESISFGSTVYEIGNSAFKGCTKLKDVHTGNRLTLIGDSVFENCTSLRVGDLGRNLCKMGKNIFKGCIELKQARVQGRYLYSYTEGLFEGCKSLERYIVPDYIYKIQDNCFLGCTSLKSIEVSAKLRSIGYSAFADCALERFALRGLNIGDDWSILIGGNNDRLSELPWTCVSRDKYMWLLERKKD